MHIRFPGDLASDKFISIVVLSYKRPDMTMNLINSIHKHADLPFELIVHDDSSPADDKRILYEHLEQMSSLVLTGGELNMGLSASFERGVSLCSSDYVLCLNNDMIMTGPGFQRIVKVLQCPYVGAFGPWQVAKEPIKPGGYTMLVKYKDIKFHLGPMVGSGSAMAFRRSVWEEVGGWPHVMTGSSDTAFMRKLLRVGYFNALLAEGTEESWDNVDYRTGCARTTIGPNKYDASYPWLFTKQRDGSGVCPISISNTQSSRNVVENFTKTDQHEGGGINNHDWWHLYFHNNIIPEENNYNWDNLTYHQRFKEMVMDTRVRV